MWRDWLYYGKRDRLLLLVCVSLLLVIILLRAALSLFPSQEVGESTPEDEAFGQEVARQDSLKHRRRGKYASSRKIYPRVTPFTLSALHLSPFDPNTADSVQLAAMGLPPYIVRHIVHYREKGGHFRSAESLQRLYGMSDSLYAALLPYLRITETTASSSYRKDDTEQKQSSRFYSHDTVRYARTPSMYTPAEKYPLGTQIDLNEADTTELKKIPGIGSGIARAIVAYRQRLGGFSSVEQLAEVRFTSPEMQQWFVVGTPTLRKIRVNHDKLQKLQAHPYLNYYQAQAIVRERNDRGDIKSLSRLALYEAFTEKDFERLKPYLDFE